MQMATGFARSTSIPTKVAGPAYATSSALSVACTRSTWQVMLPSTSLPLITSAFHPNSSLLSSVYTSSEHEPLWLDFSLKLIFGSARKQKKPQALSHRLPSTVPGPYPGQGTLPDQGLEKQDATSGSGQNGDPGRPAPQGSPQDQADAQDGSPEYVAIPT